MRCIVAGSRTITELDVVKDAVVNATFHHQVDEIVSGGARGVDTLAGVVAGMLDLQFTEMPADWERHGRRAGYLRNEEMALYAKETPPGGLVAVWDGISRGTKHMIDIARREGLLVHVVIVAPVSILQPARSSKIRPASARRTT